MENQTPAQGCPVLVIVGIDPAKHVIPPMLAHHITKLKKDFVLGFLAKDDISDKTGEALRAMLERSKFVPQERQRIITKDNPCSS